MVALLAPRLPSECPNQRQKGARFALMVLSMIQLFNFADRYLPMALKEHIKSDLHLTDTESALPTTGFIFVYVVFAVVFGSLADREIGDRRILLAGGVLLWSVATAMAGIAQNLTQLIVARALVGVGEAAFSTIVPAYIADFYPLQDRMAAFGVYYMMAAVGGGLGYVLGGAVSSILNWRFAFFSLGVPGIMVAGTVLLLNDPARGVNDAASMSEVSETSEVRSFAAEVHSIVTNKQWCCLTFGTVACSFAIGGVAEFTPSYMHRYIGLSIGLASTVVGAATLFGGITGTIVGSSLCQAYDKHVPNAHYLIPAMFMVPASLAGYISQHTGNAALCIIAAVVFITCVLVHQVPINAASINVIHPRLRARSVGLQVMMCHLLGDMVSPPIIGMISDKTQSLQAAMQVTWMATLIASAIWFFGYHCLPALPFEDKWASSQAIERRATIYTVLCMEEESQRLLGSSTQDKTSYTSTTK